MARRPTPAQPAAESIPAEPPAPLDETAELTALAAGIVESHAAFTHSAETASEASRRCGELLLQAKERVAHGGWLDWLEAHCRMSVRTAQVHMRMAKCAAAAHLRDADDADGAGEARDSDAIEPALDGRGEDDGDDTPLGNVQFVPAVRLIELFAQALPSDQREFAQWVAEKQREADELAAKISAECRITVEEAVAEADYAVALDAIEQNLGTRARTILSGEESPCNRAELVELARRRPAAQRKAWRRYLKTHD